VGPLGHPEAPGLGSPLRVDPRPPQGKGLGDVVEAKPKGGGFPGLGLGRERGWDAGLEATGLNLQAGG